MKRHEEHEARISTTHWIVVFVNLRDFVMIRFDVKIPGMTRTIRPWVKAGLPADAYDAIMDGLPASRLWSLLLEVAEARAAARRPADLASLRPCAGESQGAGIHGELPHFLPRLRGTRAAEPRVRRHCAGGARDRDAQRAGSARAARVRLSRPAHHGVRHRSESRAR